MDHTGNDTDHVHGDGTGAPRRRVLDEAMRGQLRDAFTRLTAPVELVLSVDGSDASGELADLAAEVAELSEHVTVRHDGDGARRPSVDVGGSGRVCFAGVPGGHEFTSLVLAILAVGGHRTVDDATTATIEGLDGGYEFETYVSLSCQNCPVVVQALNLLAAMHPGIRHSAVDGALFRDEVERRGVQSVPVVFLNGELFASGRLELGELLARLDDGARERAAAELDAQEPFDVLVVGGGPAGASAAIYAARKGIRTGLVAERFGGQVLDTLGIENLISVPYIEGPQLVAALESHVGEYDVEVFHHQRVARLVPAGGDGLHTVELDGGGSLRARTVVAATGARWRSLSVPGEEEYRTRGVTNCPHCDGPLFAGKKVAVVGGGNSGVEAAIDLAGVASSVVVVEYDDRLRADEVLLARLRSLGNVEVVVSALTEEILGDGERVIGLRYRDRDGGGVHTIDADGVFVQIGLVPNTAWLDGVVDREHGEVVVGPRGETSVPGVFAAGDCTTAPYKQISVSVGAGATAALGAFDHLIRQALPAGG
jgi:alkyl hydroperoxide reductase subunit F